MRRSLRRLREEETGALWLVMGLVVVQGWVMASLLWTVERRPLWWHDNLRYVTPVAVAVLWAALRASPREDEGLTPRSWPPLSARFFALAAGFLIVGTTFVAFPVPYAHVTALDTLQGRLVPGDVVALDSIRYELVAPYLAGDEVRVVPRPDLGVATYVLSGRDAS